MNPPISTAAPTRPAPRRARPVDVDRVGDVSEPKAPYRPAHAAHARPVADDHDDLLLDLTGDGEDDVVLAGPAADAADHGGGDDAQPETPASIAVVDDVVVIFDDPVIEATPAPTQPLVGARAAARAKRRRHTGDAEPQSEIDAKVAWSTEAADAVPLDAVPSTAAAASASATAPVAADSDPLAFIRGVDAAWTAASCWVRRHATVQLVIPCLMLVALGLFAVVAADGTMQRLGQIVLTAALVTAGVAWAQAIGDQRRRQQDLRFRLASGNLERADLTGTVLDGFTLWGQNLRGAKLSGCSADHVLLSGADLREASMTGASLRVASLAGADLTGARLYRSDLRGADLTGAIAQGTSFEDAVLRGALLEGADLTGADLSGADLRGATHDEHTDWTAVVVSDDTHLPEDMPALQG
ncbi:MAG: pentapeptide repeat-containing protein [Acidimicrobiales bacterium]